MIFLLMFLLKKIVAEEEKNGKRYSFTMVGQDKGIALQNLYPYTRNKLKAVFNFDLEEKDYAQIEKDIGAFQTWALSSEGGKVIYVISLVNAVVNSGALYDFTLGSLSEDQPSLIESKSHQPFIKYSPW